MSNLGSTPPKTENDTQHRISTPLGKPAFSPIPVNLFAGELIIKQGDAADGMYFVESGTASIRVLDDGGKEIEVNRVKKGGYFGELALVTHRPRAASAYAIEDLKVACKYT